MKKGSIFHCPTISKIMFKHHFMALTRCFHITNSATYVKEKDLLRYDKLGQTRWLIEKMYTIDEIMIHYKGTYCPLQ
jgi:hypothetical protein